MAPSRSEARRLIRQGGVRLDGETLSEVETIIQVDRPRVLQVGRRRFMRLVPAEPE
jgi:tyrosyl-tRNA synthetase